MAQADGFTTAAPGSSASSVPQPKTAAATHAPIPLNSDLRVEPIHPSIHEIKLPRKFQPQVHAGALPDDKEGERSEPNHPDPTTLNPLTLQPFTMEELRSHNLETILRQYPTPEAARKAREESARELRKLLDENEKKTREIDREIEEKEKTREIERKVYARKLGKDG